jgi:4-amino-4-deoxychorismate lyase
MYQLIETIRLENGKYNNLFYHEQRMNRSMKLLHGVESLFNLEEFLLTQPKPEEGLYKCRLTYDEHSKEVEFEPYQRKKIESLRIVEHNHISYEFKFKDRSKLEKLYGFRNGCDDILIVKKGLVTDTFSANIVFRKGKQWFTPWDPLLKGTMRHYLLERDKVIAEEITVKDIYHFDTFKLINAMVLFDNPEVDVSKILK